LSFVKGYCQSENKVRTSVDANFLIATDFSSLYFNFIGAGIKFQKKNVTYSISVFPTLRFYEDDPESGATKRPFVTPGFSIGPMIEFKNKFLIGFPASYSYDSRWHYTIGVGLIINKSM